MGFRLYTPTLGHLHTPTPSHPDAATHEHRHTKRPPDTATRTTTHKQTNNHAFTHTRGRRACKCKEKIIFYFLFEKVLIFTNVLCVLSVSSCVRAFQCPPLFQVPPNCACISWFLKRSLFDGACVLEHPCMPPPTLFFWEGQRGVEERGGGVGEEATPLSPPNGGGREGVVVKKRWSCRNGRAVQHGAVKRGTGLVWSEAVLAGTRILRFFPLSHQNVSV